MKYAELNSHLNNALNGEKLAPAYIVGGSDAYLRQSAAKQFKALLNPEYSDFNLSYVSEDDGITAAVDALVMFPVFDDRKVVIIPDADDKLKDGEKAALSAYLSQPNPTSVLVVVMEGSGAKAYAKKEKIEYVDCDKLDENEIAMEMEKILAVPPARTMERGVPHALAERTQSDMSRIAQETEKLKAYSNDVITVKDVYDMVAPDLDFAIYELTGAVSEKQSDKALTVLDIFTKQGLEPSSIITMLYNQYRKMLHAELHKTDDESVLTGLLGVSSGALYHLKRVSKNYTQLRLKKCVDYLHELQFAIRSGKKNEVTALHEAVLTLLNI